MNKIRYCNVVSGNTINKFLQNLKVYQKTPELVELRADTIKKLTLSNLYQIKNELKKPAIFTLRNKAEGGCCNYSEKKRVSLISQADKIRFEYIDIELSTSHQVINSLKTKTIISYHNFKKTPSYSQLTKVINQAKNFSPYAIKITTYVNNTDDIHTLINIMNYQPIIVKKIVIGMGKIGQITRILSPTYPPHIAYTYQGSVSQAPGQIEISEMKNTYSKYGIIY
ncbi:type I 3-dehydroquinate dehydratase [Patescibacteria group bacterium]